MVGLDIDAKRRKPAIISRTKPVLWNIFGGSEKLLTKLPRGVSTLGLKRVDDADEANLFDVISVFTRMFSAEFVYAFLVLFQRMLGLRVILLLF